MNVRVDRCICAERDFSSLLDQAREQGLSLTQLVQQTGASVGCGMCRPYLCRSYRTGQCVFHELLDPDDEPEHHPSDHRPAHPPADDDALPHADR